MNDLKTYNTDEIGYALAVSYADITADELRLLKNPICDADKAEVLIPISENKAICLMLIERENGTLNRKLGK